MPQNQLHMQQLETEIARVQVELRQIRQLIGSLIRTEEQTMQMLSHQPGMQGQGMPSGTQRQFGTPRQGGAAYGGALDPSSFQNRQGQGNYSQSQFGSGQQGLGSSQRMPVPPQLFDEERRAMEQYNEMRSVAERMNKQVQNIAQAFNMDRYNPNNYSAQQMNPPYNDPMQRQQ